MLLVVAGSAVAIKLRAANLVITTDGGFSPTTLPKKGFAPIKLHGYGKIETEDGSPPPILETLTLWFDKHGEVETEGLPKCTPGKLEATTTAQARKLCPGAIVGKGFGKAVVIFPEQAPIPASSPITLFNAAPKNGNPVLLAHAHLTVPGPTTFVVPIEIQRVQPGALRVQNRGEDPEDRRRRRDPPLRPVHGQPQMDLQREEAELRQRRLPRRPPAGENPDRFKDGTFLQGSVFKPCKGR